jgi:hypothetical protein
VDILVKKQKKRNETGEVIERKELNYCGSTIPSVSPIAIVIMNPLVPTPESFEIIRTEGKRFK